MCWYGDSWIKKCIWLNSKNRFIDEGFAEYFNEQQIYDETKIHDVLEGANVNIYCYWNNFEQYSPDLSYQVAGCFVGFFIYKMGIEKSQLLMRNEEYKAARKVYRKQLDDIISQFESLTKWFNWDIALSSSNNKTHIAGKIKGKRWYLY